MQAQRHIYTNTHTYTHRLAQCVRPDKQLLSNIPLFTHRRALCLSTPSLHPCFFFSLVRVLLFSLQQKTSGHPSQAYLLTLGRRMSSQLAGSTRMKPSRVPATAMTTATMTTVAPAQTNNKYKQARLS